MNKPAKIIAGLGIIIAAVGGVTTSYYLKENKCIHGRQVNQCFTQYEFNNLVAQLKVKVKNGSLTLNDVFAVEDVINYRCPKKSATILKPSSIINFLSGKCNL